MEKPYTVTVDYRLSLEELIRVSGCGCHCDFINIEDFLVDVRKEPVDIAIELVNFKKQITADEVLEEFKATGFRSVTFVELLAFAAKYPDIQRRSPITALGSQAKDKWGGLCVPELDWDDEDGRRITFPRRDALRGVGLHMISNRHGVSVYAYFAAVGK